MTTAPRPTTAPRLTIVNALLLPMADPGTTPHPDWYVGWLTVGHDGRITGIGPGQPPAHAPDPREAPDPDGARGPAVDQGEVFDACGAIVAPGFVSAHSHIYTSGLRGLAHSETLYPWVLKNNEALLGSGAEDVYWYTLHGSLDFVDNGITSAYNFTHSRVAWLYDAATGHNAPARIRGTDYVTRQLDGCVDAGLRVVHSVRLDDEAFSEAQTLDAFAQTVEDSLTRAPADQHLGTSIMGAVQWSATARTAELEALTMRTHQVSNQAHFVETAENLDTQRAKFDWYDTAGALGPSFLFGHFVHPTDHMVARAVETGSAMVWQPTSNGRLGSGMADVARFRDLGMRIGMGLDDQSCTDVSDPFQNMRIGLYTVRARHSDASVMTPREILRMHTLGSAEVLGAAASVGSLEVGKQADLLVVDPRHPDTGPVWDVYATYVMACGLRNLTRVYQGGRLASRDGVSTNPLAPQATLELHARIVHGARAEGMHLDHVPDDEVLERAAARRASVPPVPPASEERGRSVQDLAAQPR